MAVSSLGMSLLTRKFATHAELDPLPDDKFKTSKLEEFADDNFEFDENGSKLSKRLENFGFTCLQYKPFENTVGKREIARDEQFLLFPQCFLPVWRTFSHLYQI